jgi:hypothetical protein
MTTPQEKAKKTKDATPKEERKEPRWKTEARQQKQEKQEKRTVNPMTMVPADASISGKRPLPPNAEELKRLYGF